jgi:hypothetical protein
LGVRGTGFADYETKTDRAIRVVTIDQRRPRPPRLLLASGS